jgi:hypothetical protein
LLGVRDRRARLTENVLTSGLQLVFDVQVAGGDHHVDPGTGRVAHRLPRPIDIRRDGARPHASAATRSQAATADQQPMIRLRHTLRIG